MGYNYFDPPNIYRSSLNDTNDTQYSDYGRLFSRFCYIYFFIIIKFYRFRINNSWKKEGEGLLIMGLEFLV